MLIFHHLGVSQSERVVWLLEELAGEFFNVEVKIVHHTRAPLLSPQSLKDVPGNTTGKSPFLEDTEENITISESGAILEYIIHKYGGWRFSANATNEADYPVYLQWLHFANGTLQAAMVNCMFLTAAGVDAESPIMKTADERLDTALSALDQRLGESQYLAGFFSAADIMNLYCTSTQRYWGPQISLAKYPNILRWMKDCGERPAYQRAMEKGDPEMKLLLTADPPTMSMMTAGGVGSDFWKKSASS